MKKLKYIIACIGLIVIAGCSEDFLVKEPTDSVPQSTAIVNESDLSTAIIGMYSGFQSASTWGRNVMVYGDVIADDGFVSQTNSNRFVSHQDRNYTVNNGFNDGTWDALYVIIRNANFAILEGSKLPQTANRDALLAQAYTARAWCHFELVKHFAKAANSGLDQDLGIPYVMTFDPTQRPGRNTVAEVYSNMKTDLSTALSMFNGAEPGRIFVGTTAANLLMSRIALYEEDWQNALTFAEAVINAPGFSLTSRTDYADYWTTQNASETIFEVSQTPDDNLVTNSLSYIYDKLGYGQNLASASLVSAMSSDDIRKSLYTLTSDLGDSPTGYYVDKWPFVAGEVIDVKVLRVSEAYLNAAEAAFHLPDETKAKKYLNDLVAERVTNLTYTSSGAQLLNDILTERRYELAFEGHRFFDLVRNKKDVIKTTNCNINCNMGYYNDGYVFPIPQDEMDANPNMTQNPGY